MSVQYNSQKIIPAPLLSISKEYQKSGDGQKVGSVYSIVVRGTILAYKGSPNSSGTFWSLGGYPPDETLDADVRLKAILKKQEALRELLSEEGHSFEVQPLDGSAPIKFYPRIVRPIVFDEGIWYDTCTYTIELEADEILGSLIPTNEDGFTDYLAEASESWNLEFSDQAENDVQQTTFRLTHNVGAVGKRHYDSTGVVVEAWERARTWTQPRLGLDLARVYESGTLNLPSYMAGFNHSRSVQVDKRGGGYNVTETWLIASGSALEDFTVNTVVNSEDGLDRVNIAGNIVGLEVRDTGNFSITTNKFAAAEARYDVVQNLMHSRATAYSDISNLNITPFSTTVGKNPVVGTINYTYDYNTRPSKVIDGAKSEIITVGYDNPIDIFAAIPVLGRLAGPVLQEIGASGVARKTLSIEVVMPAASGAITTWESQKPDVSTIVDAFRPVAVQVLSDQNTESWIPTNGRYTAQYGWTWE